MAGGPPSPRPSWGTSLCASPALTRPLEPRARGGATLPLQAGLSTLVPRTRVSGRAAGLRPPLVARRRLRRTHLRLHVHGGPHRTGCKGSRQGAGVPRPASSHRLEPQNSRVTRPRPPATPATFEFQPPRCKLTAQFAEANPRRRRGREPITGPSASGATPPESRLFWSAGARELDSLDPTSGSALPLFYLSPSFARSLLHFRSAS